MVETLGLDIYGNMYASIFSFSDFIINYIKDSEKLEKLLKSYFLLLEQDKMFSKEDKKIFMDSFFRNFISYGRYEIFADNWFANCKWVEAIQKENNKGIIIDGNFKCEWFLEQSYYLSHMHKLLAEALEDINIYNENKEKYNGISIGIIDTIESKSNKRSIYGDNYDFESKQYYIDLVLNNKSKLRKNINI